MASVAALVSEQLCFAITHDVWQVLLPLLPAAMCGLRLRLHWLLTAFLVFCVVGAGSRGGATPSPGFCHMPRRFSIENAQPVAPASPALLPATAAEALSPLRMSTVPVSTEQNGETVFATPSLFCETSPGCIGERAAASPTAVHERVAASPASVGERVAASLDERPD